jgi:spermidine synthase
MKNIFLYTLVIVSGAAVLALELLGTRLLGPFYGVSLFLWSALITVTLAALSVGYVIGGRWADKGTSLFKLCGVTMIGGIWIAAIPLMKHPFLGISEILGLRFAVLIAAFGLFFVPLALLGTISPCVIRLKAATLGEVGRAAGNLYAASTFASVISALSTGFFLIPHFGVTNLTEGVGGVLLIVAIAGILIQKRLNPTISVAGIVALLIILAAERYSEKPDPSQGLVAMEQSPYGELRVLDTENGRHLLIDGGIHTLVDTSTWTSNFHYAAVMDLPKYFFNQPGKMLLIGLGGGSLMKQYAKDGWIVDAVEIDPKVIDLASRYFSLKPSDGTITEADGRQFLASTENMYDVVLLDAFGSSSIPFHLVTKEAFGLMAAHLNSKGIFALNVESIGWTDPIVMALGATLKEEFKNVFVLPIEEPPDKFGNLILMASNGALEPRREPERNETLDPDWRFGAGYQRVHAWDNHFIPDTKNSVVLTDDLNPIDLRAETLNLAARIGLHEYLGKTGMAW